MYPELRNYINELILRRPPAKRRTVLQPLIDYIQIRINRDEKGQLNFICTHNSRRSQFAQVWGQTAAAHFGLPVRCYSGGTEVTACNERTIASLQRSGFEVSKTGSDNPVYAVKFSDKQPAIDLYSKLYDDPANPSDHFAAVMTCDHADANCPFIPGAEQRIPLSYQDPKAFDDTPQEAAKYDERSQQIASEMLYVFAQLNPTQ